MKYFKRTNRTVACFWRDLWGGKIKNLKTYGVEYRFLRDSAKFPYALNFSNKESDIKKIDLPEIETWCIDNLKGSCAIVISSVFIGAKFDNKEDAIIFKMNWG